MTVSRTVQTLIASVPAIVAVALAIYFDGKSLLFWMIYSLLFSGFYPLMLAFTWCRCTILPKFSVLAEARKWQQFRFGVGCFVWLLVSISINMIAFAARLMFVHSYTSLSIIFFSATISLVLLAQITTVQQRAAEFDMLSLLATIDDNASDQLELDEYLSRAPDKMKIEVLSNRKTVYSQAVNFAGLSLVTCVFAFFFFFAALPTRFDIYETQKFCFNQTMLSYMQSGEVIATTRCSYPLCSITPVESFTDPLIVAADNETTPSVTFSRNTLYISKYPVVLPAGCQQYSLLQKCDDLGYIGVVGTVELGANCTCQDATANKQQQCNKKNDAPEGLQYGPLLLILLLWLYIVGAIFNRIYTMKWSVLTAFVPHNDTEMQPVTLLNTI